MLTVPHQGVRQVSAVWDLPEGPPRATFVLAHGSGAPMSSEFLEDIATDENDLVFAFLNALNAHAVNAEDADARAEELRRRAARGDQNRGTPTPPRPTRVKARGPKGTGRGRASTVWPGDLIHPPAVHPDTTVGGKGGRKGGLNKKP